MSLLPQNKTLMWLF